MAQAPNFFGTRIIITPTRYVFHSFVCFRTNLLCLLTGTFTQNPKEVDSGAAGRTLLSRSGRESCTAKRVAGVQAFYSAGEVDKTVSWGFCVRQHEAVFEFHTYVRTIIRVFCETTFARSALGAQTADTDENSSSTEIV